MGNGRGGRGRVMGRKRDGRYGCVQMGRGEKRDREMGEREMNGCRIKCISLGGKRRRKVKKGEALFVLRRRGERNG